MYLDGDTLIAEWGVLDLTEVSEYTDNHIRFLLGSITYRIGDSGKIPDRMKDDIEGYRELLKADTATRKLFFELKKANRKTVRGNLAIVNLIKNAEKWNFK